MKDDSGETVCHVRGLETYTCLENRSFQLQDQENGPQTEQNRTVCSIEGILHFSLNKRVND